VSFGAYEIHLGVTTVDRPAVPFATLENGDPDGACLERVVGTYLHGALESTAVCSELFGVSMETVASKREQYQRLGNWFAEHGRGLDRLGLF
jgi:cobyric acid synthase